MKKKLIAVVFTFAIALTAISAPAVANVDNNNRTQNGNNGTRVTDNNGADMMETNAAGREDTNWEWIGLAGLLGLLGLRRRHENRATD